MEQARVTTEVEPRTERGIGLLGATGIGVGAIVGGGVLALAGAAFAVAGPSAIVAFALNGLLAFLTALSLAEMSAAFPDSGGMYNFAKKVMTIEASFSVGWVVWFASIAAAALYALGFGYFALDGAARIWTASAGQPPPWLLGRPAVACLALAATAFYAALLTLRPAGGGPWENIGKVTVFVVLVAGGLWATAGRSPQQLASGLSPFFAGGARGLFEAMGFTFIALQGCDLVAAVAGEIRQPARTIPRAMFLALGIALGIYLPLLFVVVAAGTAPGESIVAASRREPETIIALAAQRFFGPFGFWLVLVAAVLSMLSALRMNLLAASRVAWAMARDRTLPRALGLRLGRGTPAVAVAATALLAAAVLALVPNVSAAGAASSLIFLVTFALTHWMAILVRQRGRGRGLPFRTPFFPLVPVVGAAACVALATFQGIAVPEAGWVAAVWLGIGGVLFLLLFARPARVRDAASEALDPAVTRLRGRSPLVLVPIANPANAASMLAVAGALSPPEVGRILLLSVAVTPKGWKPGEKLLSIRHAQLVLGDAMVAAAAAGMLPEALATVAPRPWEEIGRVAGDHQCTSLVLGLSQLKEHSVGTPLDDLMGAVSCDVVVLRAPEGWKLSRAARVLVPVGGRGWHDELRARLLGSLLRTGTREITYLKALAEGASAHDEARARRALARLAGNEVPGRPNLEVVRTGDTAGAIIEWAARSDLVILGAQRTTRRQKAFGQITLRIAREASCPLIIISRRG